MNDKAIETSMTAKDEMCPDCMSDARDVQLNVGDFRCDNKWHEEPIAATLAPQSAVCETFPHALAGYLTRNGQVGNLPDCQRQIEDFMRDAKVAAEPLPAPSAPDLETRNPHGYEKNWTIENHRDELIDRLGLAIKRINSLEGQLREVLNISLDTDYSDSEALAAITRISKEAKLLPAQTKPFCLACTAVGMSHCAYPDECGQVVHPISNERLEEIATEEWCEIEECNAMAKELMLFRKNRQKAGKR